jgi:hypothetical protein
MDRPWFKLFAADVLTDAKLDSLPPEFLGLVFKMWCVCHIEGHCPSDPQELARKTRLPLAYVLQCKSQCESLFDLHNGFYTSSRMEKEKRRSEVNRSNANDRWKEKTSGIRNANGNAKIKDFALRRSDSDSDNDLDLELVVREIAKTYPRVADALNLSIADQNIIAEAVARHGDKVLDGTKRFRACYDRWPKTEHRYAMGTQKFFSTSEYLKQSLEWEFANGKPSAPEAGYESQSVIVARELAARKAQGL